VLESHHAVTRDGSAAATLTFASWNRIAAWLVGLEGLLRTG
jgi:hypothetical protein